MNRYSLVIELDGESKLLNSIDEYKELIKKFKKNNSNKSSEYIYGNVTYRVINNEYLVFYDVYKRITMPSELKNLYNVTTSFNDSEELKRCCDVSGKLCVLYFETMPKNNLKSQYSDIGVKTLPVLYNEDKYFLDKDCISEMIKYKASTKDLYFFKEMSKRFYNLPHVRDEIERLNQAIYQVDNDLSSTYALEVTALKLYRTIIYNEKDKKILNYRKLVDVWLFIKKCIEDEEAYNDRYEKILNK